MARCWSCGTHTDEYTYRCGNCATIEAIDGVKHALAATNGGVAGQIVALEAAVDSLHGTLQQGFVGIGEMLRWSTSEVSWRLEQQTDRLKSIDATLKTPSQTKANEWREMGEELRVRGVLDQAEEFFRKSVDESPLDYRTYVGLAHTYLQESRLDEAEKRLLQSLPHAPRTEGADSKSYSLRLLGRVSCCRDNFSEARERLREAVALSPDDADCHYDLSVCLGRLGSGPQAAAELAKAISIEPTFWELAALEPAFEGVRNTVDAQRTQMIEGERQAAVRELEAAHMAYRSALAASGKAAEVAAGLEQSLAIQSAGPLTRIVKLLCAAREGSESARYREVLDARRAALAAGQLSLEAEETARDEKRRAEQQLGSEASAREASERWRLEAEAAERRRQSAQATSATFAALGSFVIWFIPAWAVSGFMGCASSVFSGGGNDNFAAPFSAYGTTGVVGGILVGGLAALITFSKRMS